MLRFNFLMIIIVLSLSLAIAGDRKKGDFGSGNGGSESELAIALNTQLVKQTISKIQAFFVLYPKAKRVFPEVNFNSLERKIKKVRIRVTKKDLYDRYGVQRTALNYKRYNLIRFNASRLGKLVKRPKLFFALVFHELLGLINVEVSNPKIDDLMKSYPISSRLAKYVRRTSQFDLVFTPKKLRKVNRSAIIFKSNGNKSLHLTAHFAKEETEFDFYSVIVGVYKNRRKLYELECSLDTAIEYNYYNGSRIDEVVIDCGEDGHTGPDGKESYNFRISYNWKHMARTFNLVVDYNKHDDSEKPQQFEKLIELLANRKLEAEEEVDNEVFRLKPIRRRPLASDPFKLIEYVALSFPPLFGCHQSASYTDSMQIFHLRINYGMKLDVTGGMYSPDYSDLLNKSGKLLSQKEILARSIKHLGTMKELCARKKKPTK